ncbi:MAG: transglutaminase family protein [Bernardetiaceae bacterium]|jgi:transglutaminase-like putative cysteine protease|nr:transglutaminase family protein [Bernardetiaceae bacterium]
MTIEYQVAYHTRNTYDEPVKEAIYNLLVVPCSDATQQVTNLRYQNSAQAEVFTYQNLFGFQAASLRATPGFQVFEISMTASVEKKCGPAPAPAPLPVATERALLQSVDFLIDHHLFLHPTPYTSLADDHWPLVPEFGAGQTVLEYLHTLNAFTYGFLKFTPNATDVHTTATEVMDLREGVCQDFAHFFITMARHQGIPARYVSGYLNQGEHLTGDSVMHAWVEAWVPGYGWLGFDPTNHLLADHNHVKVAHGVDYADCSPLRGVITTNSLQQKTEYQVTVLAQKQYA